MTLPKILFTLIFVIMGQFLFSQQETKTSNQKETTKVYYYTFSGVLNPDNIEQIKEEILRMRFVAEVKVEYKAEKALGQIKLIAKEYYTNNDTDFEFNIYNLKMLLIQNNLFPNDYKFEVISK